MNRALALAIVAIVASGAAFMACSAAKPPGYAGYCHVEDFANLLGSAGAADCTTCLIANCCDAYGACQDTKDCTSAVADEYTCFLDAGTLALTRESVCVSSTAPPASTTFFACAEAHCPNECSLSAAACTPTPATPVINPPPADCPTCIPTCDDCVTASCCTALNSCYASRSCALTFQCIIRCQGTFSDASDLTTVFDEPELPSVLDCATKEFCGDAGLKCPAEGIPECFKDCTAQYSQEEGAADSICLSINLFQCAAMSCGTPDAGVPGPCNVGGQPTQ